VSSVKQRIRAVHSPAHADAIGALAVTGPVAELAAATAMQATRLVHEGSARNAFCAIRPPGHHVVNQAAEEGFCFLANVAIAARYIQDVLGYKRVLIVDWDFHHGNGTQYFFYDDPTVLFCSTHQCNYYPQRFCNSYTYNGESFLIGSDESCRGIGPGEGFNINIDMPCGAVTQDFLNAWQERLLPKVATFKPDFILISAGFDSKANDSLGCFSITPEGFAQMTQLLMDVAAQYCNNRLVSILEGGYANKSTGTYEDLGSCVAAHVQALTTYQPSPTRRPAALTTPSGLPRVYQQGSHLIIDAGQRPAPQRISLVNLRGQQVLSAQLPPASQSLSLSALTIAPGHYLAHLYYRSPAQTQSVAVQIGPDL
jgi:acetoin utilization deacetylase AcuC-like enzyme